jgi:hypothetical protein
MTAREATAEVFWTAFRTLPRASREAVLGRLLRDRRTREDFLDIAVSLARTSEKSIPYEKVRAHLRKTGRL